MNLLSLSNLGVASTSMLAGLPVAVLLLVYVYLRKDRRKTIVVPSLLLFRNMSQVARSPKLFRPPWRLLFELLLLSLLILSAAGLYWTSDRGDQALLIDNSFSMAGAINEDGQERSVLELARRDAISFVTALPAASSVAIYTTTPSLTLLGGRAVSQAEAVNLLEGIQLGYGPDNLEAGIRELLGQTQMRITVFSDRQLDRTGLNSQVADRIISRGLISDKTIRENISISGLRSIKEGDRIKLEVVLSAFVKNAVPVKVELQGVRIEHGQQVILPLDEREASVGSNQKQLVESNTVKFDLINSDIKSFRVALKVQDKKKNAIEPDDFAWFALDTERSEVVLVSDFKPADLNLNEIDSIDFYHQLPSEYESSSQLTKYPHIFHRYMPKTTPVASALFINPESSGALLSIGPKVSDAKVTRWQSTDPLLTYLNISTLTFSQLHPLTPLPWMRPVIQTTAGAAIVSGELGVTRFVACGFELLPYEAGQNPTLSVLTLNALKWIVSFSTHSMYREVGEKMALRAEFERAAFIGQAEALSPVGLDRVVQFTQPGLVELSAKKSQLLAVNYFDIAESNLLSVAPVLIDFDRASDIKPMFQRQSLMQQLLTIVLLLLVVDLLLNLSRMLFQRARTV